MKNSKRLRKATVASCSVREICKTLSVSEKGYYKWLRNRKKQSSRLILLEEIRKIIGEHQDNRNYGVPRMRLALLQKGIKRSQSTVRRAMILAKIIVV